LHKAHLENASFCFTDLRRADLRQAHLSRTDFEGADLREASFTVINLKSNSPYHHASLDETNLSHAKLCGNNLSRADLRRANLSGADLSRANLNAANLHGANLHAANLSAANLRFADLGEADLHSANLKNANMQGATMGNTFLADIDLRAVKGLSELLHRGPSYVVLHTILLPQDGSALRFLRGAGIPNVSAGVIPSRFRAFWFNGWASIARFSSGIKAAIACP
jgi:uncharacterized protein YjbI with pentapeptide repeats